MRLFTRPIMLAGVIAIVLCTGITLVVLTHASKPNDTPRRTAAATHKTSGASSTDTTNTTDKAQSSSESSSSPKRSTETPSPACKALTQAIAADILGSDAKTAKALQPTAPPTSGTSVSTCTYSSAAGTIQLSLRAPQNSLGVSKNATVFGSERPPSAASVEDYGQTAYWNPANHSLNILTSNTWYLLVRVGASGQPSDQASTQDIANHLTDDF